MNFHVVSLIYIFFCFSVVETKLRTLHDWHVSGKKTTSHAGCLLIGYEAYRTLVTYHDSKTSKKLYTPEFLDGVRKKVQEYLLDPGNVKPMTEAQIK